jgi:SAM-dependent methyltransferase
MSTDSRPCPGCLSSAGTDIGTANGFDIRRCGSCATLFTAALPTAAAAKDYESFYAGERNLAVPAFVLGRLEQTVSSLERYRSLNRWLDIGCGTGTLLQAVRNKHWEGVGTEVAPAAVQAVRAAGLEVRLGETGDLDLPAAGFDLVSMVEVIEHVPDPHELIADAARLVRPGGALYLTTPHGRGISARLLRTRWSVVTPPDHLQLLSLRGLRAALERAGLVVRSVSTHGLNPYELAAGLRFGRVRTATHGNTETSYRLNESLSTHRSGVIVKRAVNGVLSTVRLGDTLKVVAERRGP